MFVIVTYSPNVILLKYVIVVVSAESLDDWQGLLVYSAFYFT